MFLQRIGNSGIQLGRLFDRAAARHPANILLLDHDLDCAPELGRRLTIGELADFVADYASRLWAADVRPGERVVVYKSNSFDISLLACAIARIGAVPVMLSPKLDGETVAELIRRVDRPLLLTDETKIREELPDKVFELARRVLLASGEDPRGTTLSSLAGAPRVDPVTMPADHPTLVTHTSGTTGIPKLAIHTGWTFQARYRPQASVASMVRKRQLVAIHVSFVHSRLVTALAIALLRGFPLLILADDSPEHIADLFSRLKPGVVEAHPNTFMRWEPLAYDARRPLASVKYFSSTFDAIHPRTVQRMLGASRYRAPIFAQLYGQSEIGPVVGRTFTRSRGVETDGRCVGYPFPGMTDIRIVSVDGRPPSAENPGYIEARSDGRVLSYLGEPERYQKQLDNGWWRMGDVGYKTRWGCLHLLDREVDVIPGFGSTLAAEDLLLARLDELTEVIVIPGPDGTAIPVIATRDDKPIEPARWREAVASLPPMAEPVHRRLDELPHTATEKIKRLELAKQLKPGDTPG